MSGEWKGHGPSCDGCIMVGVLAERDEARSERDAALARVATIAAEVLAPVRALHVPWYEIAGVRHEHRVLVGWDEAPDDHVCVIGRSATRLDTCEPGEMHAVLACSECRASGQHDADVEWHPFYPCATIAALPTPTNGVTS